MKGVPVTEVDSVDRPQLHLRQVTDGRHFVQLIYSGEDELRDCEYVTHAPTVHAFLDTFRHDMEAVRHGGGGDAGARNVTVRVLGDDEALPDDLAAWLDYPRLREACEENHNQIRRLLDGHQRGEESAKHELERRKRSLQDALMAPGTKWCGKHHRADTYSSLGAFSHTDRCCRRHDQCKMAIPSFATKFGLFNHRPFTISYCGCDKRFRTCLKVAGNGPANLVGKLFFNVVQTKCFVLKPKKVCLKTSWWGKCIKWQVKKQAHLRDNTPY
ncbi:group 3 secretory phospholipase A2 [Frankliniella occidentalis]|uniref:Phospholipase A2 n=1 Tax=Frankliniella occidentalis TaxID=133901 RepID=A0A9C6U8G3_FRAOC|nr:group 3 secretory phospholipase A2 [Frankliniella occidentalis]